MIYFLYMNTKETDVSYLLLLIPLFLMFLEGIYTINIKSGFEFYYFWPSGLLYIATILPIIWIMELDAFDKTHAATGNTTIVNLTTPVDIFELEMFELLASSEIFRKIWCEFGIFFVLTFGRWTMPRGHLSRHQLSTLMLNFVGITPDIMELMDSLSIPKISRRDVKVVLAIYTIGMLQFTLMTTSSLKFWKGKKLVPKDESPTLDDKKQLKSLTDVLQIEISDDNINMKSNDYNDDIDNNDNNDNIENNNTRDNKDDIETIVMENESEQDDVIYRCKWWHDEFYQILVTLTMHNGPFFLLRLILCFEYKVFNELHIFFLIQNGFYE